MTTWNVVEFQRVIFYANVHSEKSENEVSGIFPFVERKEKNKG